MNIDLTGNDYVSITRIRADGAVGGINVLHAGAAGLIEWLGDDDAPLLQPMLSVDGAAIDFSAAQWRRMDRWIPTFTLIAGDVTFTGIVCAPAGYPAARGFFLRIEAENRGRKPCTFDFALQLNWRWTMRCIATSRPLDGRNQLLPMRDGILVMESNAGRGPALAIVGNHTTSFDIATDVSADNGTALHARLQQSVTLQPNRRVGVSFYVGAGRERDGAAASVRVLRRMGADQWLRQTRFELSHILRAAHDHRWAEMLNRNLLFNRFFAVGRAIDDDRLYLLRSRVTAATAPAIFNEREALLWTIPSLILADPGLAREALFRACEMFSERSGEFQRYIDGGSFDPGFNLEQFLLYSWCALYFSDATGETALLDEPLIQQILRETDIAAFTRLHPQHLLAGTELLPTGDPADYPYTTMGNALLWLFSSTLTRVPETQDPDGKPRFAGATKELDAAVWQHCVTDVGGDAVLVSSTDTEGGAAVYDDPALSLAMLPFFGFCTADDPVWRSTMEFLRSRRYPLWRDGTVSGIASRSNPRHAVLSALCADLLGHDPRDALDRLLRIELPAGVAAAAYDPENGDAVEPYHAALAGFLAWTLLRAAQPLDQGKTARKKRRSGPRAP